MRKTIKLLHASMETLESPHVDALERGAVECVGDVWGLIGDVCGG